jgi:hypothetical protein
MSVLHGNSIQEHLQRQWISDLFSSRDQLVYIPVRPHELSLEKLSFGARKPDLEMARQID